jgi:hypothetical protein
VLSKISDWRRQKEKKRCTEAGEGEGREQEREREIEREGQEKGCKFSLRLCYKLHSFRLGGVEWTDEAASRFLMLFIG